MRYPHLLWEGTDGNDEEMRLVVTDKTCAGYEYVIESATCDAMNERSWRLHHKATYAITEEESFVPVLIADLVRFIMSARELKDIGDIK